jgi:hypothetical protein
MSQPAVYDFPYNARFDAGLTSFGSITEAVQTVSSAATTVIDFSLANSCVLSLGASITTLTLNNINPGMVFRIVCLQAGGGSHTIAWPTTINAGGTAVTFHWTGGSAPTLTTTNAKADVISFLFDGANIWELSIVTNQ